jgi:hypothetical protein
MNDLLYDLSGDGNIFLVRHPEIPILKGDFTHCLYFSPIFQISLY